VSVAWQSNQSNATDTRAVLTNYSGGSYGAGLDANAVQAETRAVLADLEAIVAGTTAAASTSAGAYVAHIENWTTNPLSRGSYCANALGYFTDIADLEGVACGALHFAGEHTSSFYEWQGFMEGAALSGDRAALEVWRGSR
jgi:monoamine oxidase